MLIDFRRRGAIIFFSALLISSASVVYGATDSLCCYFNSSSDDLKLKIEHDYTYSGVLPFRLCDLKSGLNYRVSVFGRGYEKRDAFMKLEPGGLPTISGMIWKTAFMNGTIPASGTLMRGRDQQGYIDLLSISCGLYLFYEENSEYNELKDRYDRLSTYLQTSSSIDESEVLRREAHRAYIYADQQDSYRKQLLIFASALYAFQIIEPIFIDRPPAYDITENEARISFSGSRKSTTKAFLYSLIRPGRGQYYQGKRMRGLLYSTLSVLAGYVALDQNNQYHRKLDDYDICLDEYKYARTVSERREYLRSAAILNEDAEDAKFNRNLSLYLLAGVWGANLIDILLFECEGTQCSYSFNLTPASFQIAYRF